MSSAGSHTTGQAPAQSHTGPYIDSHRISKSSTVDMLAINSIYKRPESQYLELNYYARLPVIDNSFSEPKWGEVSNNACLYKLAVCPVSEVCYGKYHLMNTHPTPWSPVPRSLMHFVTWLLRATAP